jgi:DNA replication licensing factor MCM2
VTPTLRISQVMLESFLQAQKVSVRKSLQRSFRKYLTYGEASNQLLMHKLQGLIVEVDKYKLVRIRCSLIVTMARV